MPDEPTYRETVQSEKSPLTRAVPEMDAEDAVTMLFEAALRKTYTDLSETESNGATPFSGIQPVVTQLAVN